MPKSYGFGLRVKLIDLSKNHVLVERSGSIFVNEYSDREFSKFFYKSCGSVFFFKKEENVGAKYGGEH